MGLSVASNHAASYRVTSNMYEHIWHWQSSVMCCMCEQADVDNILMWFSGYCPEFMCERGSSPSKQLWGLDCWSQKQHMWKWLCEIWHLSDILWTTQWFQKIISQQHWLVVALVLLWPQQCNSTLLWALFTPLSAYLSACFDGKQVFVC